MKRTNFITKDNVVEQLLSDDLIHQSYVYSDKSEKYWKITEPICVTLSTGRRYTIPRGFVYDMSTVPKWLWSIVRPFNDGLFGYLVHDRLYVIRDHNMTRKQVDREMLFWTNITNSNKLDNYVRYFVVRAIGWWVWYKITQKIIKFLGL
jgi:hypothetical protein